MNKLDVLDLLYHEHSCSDCEQQSYCALQQTCDDWKQQSTETEIMKKLSASMGIPVAYLMKESAKEFAKEIDSFVITQARSLDERRKAKTT
jgi:hypothetical protein